MRGKGGKGTAAAVAGLVLAGALAATTTPAAPVTDEQAPTVVRTYGLGGDGVPIGPQVLDAGDVARAADGTTYVTDTGNDRVVVFDATGAQVASWDGPEAQPLDLRTRSGIAVEADGNVLVTDSTRLLRLSPSGALVATLVSGLSQPSDVEVAANGEIYFGDPNAGLVRVLEPTGGTQLRSFAASDTRGIAVDASGNAYVTRSSRVYAFGPSGTLLGGPWGGSGSGDLQLQQPEGIDLGADGNLSVTDSYNEQVQVLTTAGAFVARFSVAADVGGARGVLARADGSRVVAGEGGVHVYSPAYAHVATWATRGDGQLQLDGASGIDAAADGTLWIADAENDRLLHITVEGQLLAVVGGSGTAPGQLDGPTDVVVADDGTLWTVEAGNDRVQHLTAAGVPIAAWRPSSPSIPSPTELALGIDGSVYVAETTNDAIHRYDADGSFRRRLNLPGLDDAQGVAVDRDGNVVFSVGTLLHTYDPTLTTLLGTVRLGFKATGIEVDSGGALWLAGGPGGPRRTMPDGTVLVDAAGTSTNVDVVAAPGGQLVGVGPASVRVWQLDDGPLFDAVATAAHSSVAGTTIQYQVRVAATGDEDLDDVLVTGDGVICDPAVDVAAGEQVTVTCDAPTGPTDDGIVDRDLSVAASNGSTLVVPAPSVAVTLEGPPTELSVERGYWSDRFFVVASWGHVHSDLGRFDQGRTDPDPDIITPTDGNDLVGSLSDGALGAGDDLYLTQVVSPPEIGTPDHDSVVQRWTQPGVLVRTYDAPGQSGRYVGGDLDRTSGRVFVAEATKSVCTEQVMLDPPYWTCTQSATIGATRVVRFEADGTAATTIVPPGSGPQSVVAPTDLAAGAGLVHVAEAAQDRVQTYTADGTFVRTIPAADVTSVAVGPDGVLYVASPATEDVRGYAPDGSLLLAWPMPHEGYDTTRANLAVGVDGRIRLGFGPPSVSSTRDLATYERVAAGLDVQLELAAGDDEVTVGESIDASATVTNTGGRPLTGVALDDPNADCEAVATTLAVGAEDEVACTHVATEADVGPYEHTATADSDQTDAVDSNTVSSTVVEPDPECLPPAFSDVSALHPFFADVCWMDLEGISAGYADGTYRPNTDVSRSAMSAFLYRAAGEPAFDPPGTATFADVSPSHPFFAEVEWMADEGISAGYADGTYRPNTNVSRSAMSAFLYRAAGEPAFDPPGTATFADVSPSHPFFAEVEWMADEGISTGYADGTYRPNTNVSRSAMSAFLHRASDG